MSTAHGPDTSIFIQHVQPAAWPARRQRGLTAAAVKAARCALGLFRARLQAGLFGLERHRAVGEHEAWDAYRANAPYRVEGRVTVAKAQKGLQIPDVGTHVYHFILTVALHLDLNVGTVRASPCSVNLNHNPVVKLCHTNHTHAMATRTKSHGCRVQVALCKYSDFSAKQKVLTPITANYFRQRGMAMQVHWQGINKRRIADKAVRQ